MTSTASAALLARDVIVSRTDLVNSPRQLEALLNLTEALAVRRRPVSYFAAEAADVIAIAIEANLVRRFLDGAEPWLELDVDALEAADPYVMPTFRSGLECGACGTALVDDGRGAPYDAATDDGTPHACPVEAPASCSCDAMPYAHAAGSACY